MRRFSLLFSMLIVRARRIRSRPSGIYPDADSDAHARRLYLRRRPSRALRFIKKAVLAAMANR